MSILIHLVSILYCLILCMCFHILLLDFVFKCVYLLTLGLYVRLACI